MKFGTVLADGRVRGAVFGKNKNEVHLLDRSARDFIERGGVVVETLKGERARKVQLLPPITNPQKIVCIGLNYREHAEELQRKHLLDNLPSAPTIFLKPPSALIATEEDIVWPHGHEVDRIDYEAEIAVVIRGRAKDVREKDAEEHIAGYSCMNDVTARHVQEKDKQWTRAKSYDTFAPFGPVIETDLNHARIGIKCKLNGKLVQNSSTGRLIFSIPKLISFVSSVMTLYPGDIISTGSPAGSGELHHGDKVEVIGEGIGTLRNYVR